MPDYPVYEDGTTVYLLQELNDGDKVYNYSEDGLFTTDFSEVADYLEAEGQDFYFEGEAKVAQARRLVSPQSVIEYVEARVGDFIDEDYVYGMCDRLNSEESVAELEKLLVGYVNKYLPPICEVVNVVRKELPPT